MFRYSLSDHPPECCFTPGYGWNVWQVVGAVVVLQNLEYIKFLEEKPDASYLVNFANGATAKISSEDHLWKEMMEIVEVFEVEVMSLGIKGEYVSWTGEEGDLGLFDAIRIKVKS